MYGYIVPVLAVIAAGTLTILSVWLILRFCCLIKKSNQPPPENLENGIAPLHQINFNGTNKTGKNYYVFRRGTPLNSKPLFSWSENPSLVTDAVEEGWSRFAFTNYATSPAVQSSRSILRSCAVGDHACDDHHVEVEISWEVCHGSADFMQKIRLNSGLKKINTNSSSTMAVASVIKSALPLPGPPLGNSSSFPQEAYFEITIMSNHDSGAGDLGDKVKAAGKNERENVKLIKESPNEKTKYESLIHVSNQNSHLIEELTHGSTVKDHHGEGKGGNGIVTFSMGLTVGELLPLKLPGSFPGSVGFNSNGSVFLDGTKLVFESEMEEWGRGDAVIGCGFNPSQKRVFFTVDSQLVHEIHCKTEDYGSPLYPTMAANSDTTVLVNFGQSEFKYAPANLHRTPNPCFIGGLANGSALGYEDSKELFSMGRIDSLWLNRSSGESLMLHDLNNNKIIEHSGDVSEVDMFEIVMDRLSTGRSPQTPL